MKTFALIITLLLFPSHLFAQKTEIAISFSEQFFDALLDAVFQHSAPPEFSLASRSTKDDAIDIESGIGVGEGPAAHTACNESIKLLRESDGVRTGVKIRDGKIIAPIAFTGYYNPPLIGCVPFGGWAETVIDLEFDATNQRLIARARADKVSLSGTGGIGSGLIAKMVQGTIDKKINPIEIIKTDKVTFLLPIQNSNGIRMKATGFRYDLVNGLLNVRIAYEFEKVK